MAPLATLFGLMYFVQGVGAPSAGLVLQPIRSILRSFGDGPAEISAFVALASLPWAFKPLFGIVSDFVPILGSRRRSYLLLATLLTTVCFGLLFQTRLEADQRSVLLALLVATTCGIALSDVVIDALMVERGRPLGLTGVLQSVQWAATYGATIITGALGGLLVARGLETWAFGVCALLCAGSLLLAAVAVREPSYAPGAAGFRTSISELGHAIRSPTLLGVAAFLTLWSFDPLSTTIVYLRLTGDLALGEQFFGYCLSMLAIGCVAGSIAYGFYCRRVRLATLTHAAIWLGALSQLCHYFIAGPTSALIVHVFVGLTWMTASLIQLDLAARACPPLVAATVFATLMALTNLASSAGEWLGGRMYESFLASFTDDQAFTLQLLASAAVKASCWLIFLILPQRRLLAELQNDRV